jgi:hypothetical protein
MNEPERRPPVIRASTSISLEELAADEWAEASIRERLPRVRAVATAWGATVTAITALFGVGTIAGSDTVVTKLSKPWGVLYGVLVGGALMAAAISLLFASLAAQFRRTEISPGIASRQGLHERIFQDTVRDLRRSRLAAGLAILLLVLAMSVRWYGPQKPTPAGSSLTAGRFAARIDWVSSTTADGSSARLAISPGPGSAADHARPGRCRRHATTRSSSRSRTWAAVMRRVNPLTAVRIRI